MTRPEPQPQRQPPTPDPADRRAVKPGQGTDGVTPDDAAPPQAPDEDDRASTGRS